jgi:hypothetical protein
MESAPHLLNCMSFVRVHLDFAMVKNMDRGSDGGDENPG